MDTTSSGAVRRVDPSERFLVTGSEGCIGSWVVRTLVETGCSVVAADLTTEARRVRHILPEPLVQSVTLAACDIIDPGAVARLVDEHQITRIIHLAALQIPFVAADPVRGAEVNLVGTLRVLEAARHSDGQVRNLCYASSSAIFGVANPRRPETLYGALKLCNEQCAAIYAREYGMPSVGLRPCVVYGVNRDQGLTAGITHAIKAAALGVEYRIPFGGSVDVQYVQDVARSFINSALAAPEDARVFDLHGELLDVGEIIRVIEALAPDCAGHITAGSDPIPSRVDFDDSELRAFLGSAPKTPFEVGAARTLNVFREQKAIGALDLPR